MTVGERIKKAREEKSITQIDLATALNISKQNLYKYENNIITNIPSDKIEAIAKYLRVSPAYLMGWDCNPKLSTNQMLLTNHEKNVITAYRDKPEMQPAVDKLLGVNGVNDEEMIPVPTAARSESNRPVEITQISKEMLERIKNATPVLNEEDI